MSCSPATEPVPASAPEPPRFPRTEVRSALYAAAILAGVARPGGGADAEARRPAATHEA